jgi:hypothetical protein
VRIETRANVFGARQMFLEDRIGTIQPDKKQESLMSMKHYDL